MRPITIDADDGASIHRLYNFIFVDKKQRGPHIHTIHVPVPSLIPGPSEELSDRLLAIFASATRVRNLSIYLPDTVSSFLSDPRIVPAVAAMTSLQNLSVVTTMNLASVLLRSTRSALKTFGHGHMGEGSEPPDFISVAPQLASSLEQIVLPFEFFKIARKSNASFPAVRSIDLAFVCRPFQPDMLLTVFPNLRRTLVICDHISIYGNEDLAAFRAENREARKACAWKGRRLDRVAASPDMLYGLGLACPIRHLTLRPAPQIDPGGPQASGNARAVLHEYAPTHLALAGITLPHGFSVIGDSLFPDDAVATLTHLVLSAEYRNTFLHQPPGPAEGEEEPSWDAVLDPLIEGLKTLRRLTHVRVIVHCDIECLWGSYSAAICDSARSFKFDRLLAALPRLVPSLTHIFITSSGCRSSVGGVEGRTETWNQHRAWRVRRPSAGSLEGTAGKMHHLEQLSAAEGKAAIDREEMTATRTCAEV